MPGSDTRAARRYATALFAAAQKLQVAEAVERDLESALGTLRRMPRFRRAWESPLIPAERKKEIVTRTLGDSVQALTIAFLSLLIDKRREDILYNVREWFRALADDARRLVRARATFAVQPTEEEAAALIASLEKRTGERVELEVCVDPLILGGVTVRMRDSIMDGSVRGAIERLRGHLLQEA